MEVNTFNIPDEVDKQFTSLQNLFVCNQNDFNDKEQSMVNGMIKAVKLELDLDIKILQLEERQNLLLSSPQSSLQHLFLFGIDPKRLGLNIVLKPYKIYETEKFSIVLCHKLSRLQSDKAKKMVLWKILQHIYIK